MRMFFSFLCLALLRSEQAWCRQVLSKTSDDYTPTHLWKLDTSHHGQSSNLHTLYAYLNDVTLAPGPFSNDTNAALFFSGNSSSYVDIPNRDAELNATSVFSWVMQIRPTSVTPGEERLILEYWDGTAGIRFKQSGRALSAEVTDTTGNVHTLSTTDDVLSAGQWKFVTLSFMGFDKTNMRILYADYNAYDISLSVDIDVPEGTMTGGLSDVRLGVSVDPSLAPFAGSIACLRYYDKMIIRFKMLDSYTLSCDPDSGIFPVDSLSEYTYQYVESTTVVVTTQSEQTTAQTTQQEETTSQTTQDETTPQTTQQEETTSQTTQQEETTSQTTQQEETTSQTTQQEETTSQTTQQEETTSQTTQQEETTSRTTQQEETTSQTTQQEETTPQTTQQEETTSQTTQQEETTSQTTQQEETTSQTTQDETTPQTLQQEETTSQTTQQEETTSKTPQDETTPQTTQQEETTPQTTQQDEPTAQLTKKEGTTSETTQEQTPTQTSQHHTMASTAEPTSDIGVQTESTRASFTGTTSDQLSYASPTMALFNATTLLITDTPLDVCVQLTLEPGNGTTFSPTTLVLADAQLYSLNACVGLCLSYSDCKAIAVEKSVKDLNSVGTCLVAGNGYQKAENTGYYLYQLAM